MIEIIADLYTQYGRQLTALVIGDTKGVQGKTTKVGDTKGVLVSIDCDEGGL